MEDDPNNDQNQEPDPAVFEAIRKKNNLSARNKARSVLDSPETKRAQHLNRGHGTVTVEMERTILPEVIPSLGASGYGAAVFSRTYTYGHEGILPPDTIRVQAFDTITNTTEAFVIHDYGTDENGEAKITVEIEDDDNQVSLGFSSESGELTGDIGDYDPEKPDGFVPGVKELTAQERVRLEAILNASGGQQ